MVPITLTIPTFNSLYHFQASSTLIMFFLFAYISRNKTYFIISSFTLILILISLLFITLPFIFILLIFESYSRSFSSVTKFSHVPSYISHSTYHFMVQLSFLLLPMHNHVETHATLPTMSMHYSCQCHPCNS